MKSDQILIVDYGMGNIGSLINMLRYLNKDVIVSKEYKDIDRASKIILPGVGAFDSAMKRINKTDGLLDSLNNKALIEKVPFLGICLGMQLITNRSEEGEKRGLGWIDAVAKKFPNDKNFKVPHMGWNEAMSSNNNLLINNKLDYHKYYFVHSFYVKVKNSAHSIMKTQYSCEFDSAIAKENIFGVQFHPEKSHKYGMEILTNFSNV